MRCVERIQLMDFGGTMNSLSKHPVLLILFTLLLLAGCGGVGGGGSKPHTEPPPPSSPTVTNQPITENGADLSNTGLTATQAQVFELLKITGLPEGSRAENFHGERTEEHRGGEEWR